MSTTRYLADTSAFARLSTNPEVRAAWQSRLVGGLVSVCPITELEILFSARSKAHREEMADKLSELFTWTVMPDHAYQRAADIQSDLTDRGAHRSAGPVDLLIAATAELQGMTLLHYDTDFVTVSDTTGQRTQWVAEPGSVD